MITIRAPDGAKKSVKKVWGVRRRIRSKKKLSSYDSVTGFFHLQVGCEMERLPVPKIHKYKYTNTNTQALIHKHRWAARWKDYQFQASSGLARR